MKKEVITMTPEKAEELLGTVSGRMDESENPVIDAIVSDMENGKFDIGNTYVVL